MRPLLLIHDVFHGSWIWRQAQSRLLALGAEVHAPTLRGCGPRRIPGGLMPSLEGWVEDLCAEIYYQGLRDILLVGHGLGGHAALAVAGRMASCVAGVVLLEAPVPERDRSYIEVAGQHFQRQLFGRLVQGSRILPPTLEDCGVHGDEGKRWLSPRQQDAPLDIFEEPFTWSFPRAAISRTLLLGMRSRMTFDAQGLRNARARGWHIQDLDAGHCPMVSHPELLATTLVQLARQTGANREALDATPWKSAQDASPGPQTGTRLPAPKRSGKPLTSR